MGGAAFVCGCMWVVTIATFKGCPAFKVIVTCARTVRADDWVIDFGAFISLMAPIKAVIALG